MSVREFVILGSSAQVPTRHRNHNGYFLRWDDEGYLFDPGEGTQRQMIFADVAASSITGIAISHFHGDHCLGLAGVVQRMSLDKLNHSVRAYFPRYGERYFEHLLDSSAYLNRVQISRHPISAAGVIFEDSKHKLETRRLEHRMESWGYRLQEHDDRTMNVEKLKAYGISGRDIGVMKTQGFIESPIHGILKVEDFSEERRGQSFAFIMDTMPCESAYLLARDVDLLVCESTYLSSEEKEAKEHTHMTAAQAAQLAREAGVGQLVLTHFSQRYTSSYGFYQEASAIFENVIVARDYDKIQLPKRHRKFKS